MSRRLWMLEVPMEEQRTFIPASQLVPFYALNEEDAVKQSQSWLEVNKKDHEGTKLVQYPHGFLMGHSTFFPPETEK